MRSLPTRIRFERRRTAIAITGAAAIVVAAAWWALMPREHAAIPTASDVAIVVPHARAASAKSHAIDVHAFDRVLWSTPRSDASRPVAPEAPASEPPRLSLVAITRDAGAWVAAVQHHGRQRLVLVEDGAELDGFTAHVTEGGLSLTRADERHELRIARRDSGDR